MRDERRCMLILFGSFSIFDLCPLSTEHPWWDDPDSNETFSHEPQDGYGIDMFFTSIETNLTIAPR